MIAHPSVRGSSDCPGRELLCALSLGRLSEEVRGEVERHIAVCDSCVALLHSIDDGSDPLLADLRGLTEPGGADEDADREWTWSGGFSPSLTGSDESRGSETGSPCEGLAPRRLGDYRFLEPLGRGGMGTVYRAIHTRLGKVVALKVIRPDRLGHPEALDRFRREMRALGGLEHHNLVRALDAREEAGVLFLVMEYVEGIDLARLLVRQGRLTRADACEVVRQAATGLDYAHRSCGLVHRDIKPSNLMITPEGCVKILDLGIASFDPGPRGPEPPPGTGVTSVDERVGTYDYMAPEQWLMSPEVDTRTDVYGLGCTLYELLAGSAPYARPEWTTWDQKMRAHTLIPPPSILERRPDIPEPLSAVLDRMLAKCPADRYATPADVVEALEPFIPGHNLPALLSPARFVPTISPVPEPAADRAGSRNLHPAGMISRPWRPRWDWSRPPTYSKPIAVSAVLAFVTLLLLAHTIASRWPGSNPAPVAGDVPKPSAPPPASIVPTGELVQATLTIRLYWHEKETGVLHDMGQIGDPWNGPQGTASVDLIFVVDATFDEPLFPYLIVVKPDGSREQYFPEKASDASARRRFQYPAGVMYESFEGKGLLALILLGSRQQLSATEALGMVGVPAEDWKRAQTDAPWLFNGERCEPLPRERDGGLGKVSLSLEPFCHSCESLSSHREIAAVRAIAFPVKPATKHP
jgi:serine/threonine protein kinase